MFCQGRFDLLNSLIQPSCSYIAPLSYPIFGTKWKVWGLSAHPTERLYATCGDDGSVRIWSLDDRRAMGSISTDCSCRALCFSPDGNSLAVGTVPCVEGSLDFACCERSVTIELMFSGLRVLMVLRGEAKDE